MNKAYDLKQIQAQVDRVLKYSQSLRNVETDALLHQWEIRKGYFIKKMGAPIYESPTPVTFELDDESRRDKVDEFLDWIIHEYSEEMYEFFKENYDGILENKTVVASYGFPAGMKLSRVLLKHFGLEAEDVRQRLSMLIQSNKISGILCLSVHPLDFLSSSENQHSWRSCHALDGEYRAGNLSYMCDYVTFMAYLKSPEDTILPRFPANQLWNNKKWRCLFFCDRDNGQIWAGRQYPFHSDTALVKVAELLRQFDYFAEDGIASKFENPYWDPEYPEFFCDTLRGAVDLNGHEKVFSDTYVFLGRDQITLEPLRKYIKTPTAAMCYNDLIDSHTYSPYVLRYKTPYQYIPQNMRHFTVGEAAPCVCCNGNRNIQYSDVMLCKDCLLEYGPDDHEAIAYCEDCGTRVIREDAYYDDEYDCYYCNDCADSHKPQCCGNCGVLYPQSKLHDYYPKSSLGKICRECAIKLGLVEKRRFFW